MDVAAAVFATLLPNAGFLAAKWVGHKLSRHIWLKDLNHPPWATDTLRAALTPGWAVANFMLGHTSYVVWDSPRHWKGKGIPMTSYVFLLLLFWTHYPVYLATHSLKCGFFNIVLAMVVAIVTFILFSKISPLAIPLMSLFMVLLAHECFYSFWLLKFNPTGNETLNHAGEGETTSEPTNHAGEGETTSGPTVPMPKEE